MLLSGIKKLFSENSELCASEICSRIGADMGLVEHALNQLIAKGIIVEVDYKSECRGCSMNCSARSERVYRLANKS